MKAFTAALLVSMMGIHSMTAIAKPLIIGHRGASIYAPENSVRSQQLAWDLGADGAEFDIYLTADSKVMVMHDKSTSRTSNGATNYDMKKSNSADLAKVDIGVWKDPAFKGELLPSLQQMFDCHPAGKVLVIEIKDGPETVGPVKDLIVKSGRPESEFRVISFNLDTVIEARKQMPTMKVYFLKGAKDKDTKKPIKFGEAEIKLAKDNKFDGLNLDYEGITPEFVQQCKDAKLDILVWTVDGKEDIQRLTKMGVEAITTNAPDTTRRYVDEALAK